MGEIFDRRIFKIVANPNTFKDKQTGFDEDDDADLGFQMFCGKDDNGKVIKMLAKEKPALVQSLDIVNDDFSWNFSDVDNVGTLAVSNTVTGLGRIEFSDDLLSGIVKARFADTADEATDFVTDFGDVSLFAAMTSLKEDTDLQAAYDNGRIILLDSSNGPVSLSADATDTCRVLDLTKLNPSDDSEVLRIVNQNADAKSISLSGDAGDGDYADGHLVMATNSLTVGGDFGSDGTAVFHAQQHTSETTTVDAILRAEYSTSYSEVKCTSRGDIVFDCTDDMSIAPDGTLTINPGSHTSFSGTNVRGIKNLTFYQILTSVSLSSGEASINWSTSTNFVVLNLWANCTAVNMTNPAGPARLTIIVENNSSIHSITGFSATGDVYWYGHVNPDTAAHNVAADETMLIELIFDGTDYHARVLDRA
jgi:hypothetical protein